MANPGKPSGIKIVFITNGNIKTILKLEHFGFDKRGGVAKKYREMMDSKQGWDYILECFKKYCEEIK